MKPGNPGVNRYRTRVESRRTVVVVGLVLSVPFASFPLEAQKPDKPYRIGYLAVGVGPSARTQSFLDGLRDLGYVEGKDFVIESRRAAPGQVERLPELAADLVRVKPNVIVAANTLAAMPAKRATGSIPIVFIASFPVERGIVTSLAQPGANVTGVALHIGFAKHLQLLKEMAPRISRVAYLYSPPTADEYTSALLAGLEADARALNVKLDPIHVRGPDDIERAFAEFPRNGTNGLLVENPTVLLRDRNRVCGLALQQKLPVIGRGREFADAGCLASYGENLDEVFRRAATYVDRILKGAKPADLPVEQPGKLEIVINTKTARALGLTISPPLLLRADQVVE